MAKRRGRKPVKKKESDIEIVEKEEAVPDKNENEFQDEEGIF